MRKKIQVFHTKDDKGKSIVSVPLANSDRYATLNEQDFNELVELGISPAWKQGADGLVQVSVPGRTNLTVARLIADASKERVRYLNRDKNDLRRDNLVLDSHGLRAKLRARDLIAPTPRLNSIEVEHVYKHGQANAVAGSVTT